jgi:sec1 family domain-containing protein 1
MIILDRNMDLTAVFHHTWTYQALVHDVLNMHLNRVIIDVGIIENNRNMNVDLYRWA